MPRAVVGLVNTFYCVACDWTVKDKWKITWHDPQMGIVRYSV
jgi:hypothetical protein